MSLRVWRAYGSALRVSPVPKTLESLRKLLGFGTWTFYITPYCWLRDSHDLWNPDFSTQDLAKSTACRWRHDTGHRSRSHKGPSTCKYFSKYKPTVLLSDTPKTCNFEVLWTLRGRECHARHPLSKSYKPHPRDKKKLGRP